MLYKYKNQIVKKPNTIVIGEETINNPTKEQLIACGYEPFIKRNNIHINKKRNKQYKQYSDELFISYLIHKELGELEEAEEIKQKWLTVRNKIKDNLPYDNTQPSVKEIKEDINKKIKERNEAIAKFKEEKLNKENGISE